ncbi:hypothetical protein [Natrarchaeobaculum aegyptiacum]|uniref:hypothetical protein n=1 Tax=Natrarchaeobaculum aegyptiacum TaxID=745377 RepID=UPI001642BABB|nr:hypothetical protein [Natrarchaeobaculum aegyptiacum]
MYRAVLPEGQILCERYEHVDEGVELFDEDDQFVAFVPYAALQAMIHEDVYSSDERSIM